METYFEFCLMQVKTPCVFSQFFVGLQGCREVVQLFKKSVPQGENYKKSTEAGRT